MKISGLVGVVAGLVFNAFVSSDTAVAQEKPSEDALKQTVEQTLAQMPMPGEELSEEVSVMMYPGNIRVGGVPIEPIQGVIWHSEWGSILSIWPDSRDPVEDIQPYDETNSLRISFSSRPKDKRLRLYDELYMITTFGRMGYNVIIPPSSRWAVQYSILHWESK